MSKQHNAHVRAHRAICRRVVDRRRDWGVGRPFQGATDEQLMVCAADALARYKFRAGWDVRQLGRYHPAGGHDGGKVLYKDVPACVIHSIMCSMTPPPADAIKLAKLTGRLDVARLRLRDIERQIKTLEREQLEVLNRAASLSRELEQAS